MSDEMKGYDVLYKRLAAGEALGMEIGRAHV